MKLSIHTLNVGHGDSLIIELSINDQNHYIIVDCHNPNKDLESRTLSFLKAKNVNHLKAVILSHPDIDHYSGMYQLINYYCNDARSIGDIIIPTLEYRYYEPLTSKRKEFELNKLYSLINNLVKSSRVTLRTASYNTIILEQDGIKIIALSPLGKHLEQYTTQVRRRKVQISKNESPSTVNANLISMILLVNINSSNSLLCSDATKIMIEGSLNKWIGENKVERMKLKFNFIKVSHHGSKYNHSELLLTKYSSRDISNAAISCGAEWPHEEVINSLKNNAINTYVTNKSGCLCNNRQLKTSEDNLPLKVKEGLASLTLDETIDESYHGDISFIDDLNSQIVTTEFDLPPIR